jgi:uncharacterized protein YkwD
VGTCSNHPRCRRLAVCTAALAALSLARAGAQEMADQVLQLVNAQRAASGLAPLVRNEVLDRAALSHSQDMAAGGFMSHTGSDGSNPGQRIQAAGYTGSTWGENIAIWYASAQAVMDAWMNSPGHRANILNPNFREIGIAVVYRADSASHYYWTQDFGARAGGSAAPLVDSSPPLGSATPAEMAAQVLGLVNAQRTANGLDPLLRASELDRAAQAHSEDMAQGNFMGHTGTDGSNPAQRIQAASYHGYTWGENVAAGFASAQAVVDAWMNSPGHRANILNPDFKEIGIACAYREGTRFGYFWTQDFGARTGSLGAASPPPALATPLLTSLDRTSGPSGTVVTLSGRNLGAAQGSSQVLFNGRAAVLRWTDAAVTVQLFATSPGTRNVWIRLSDGRDTNFLNFTVQ